MNRSRFIFALVALTACASVPDDPHGSSLDPIEDPYAIEVGTSFAFAARIEALPPDAGPPTTHCDPDRDDCGGGVCLDGSCVDACPAVVWYEGACEECTRRLVEESRCMIEEARCFECVTCETAPDGFTTTGDGPLRPCRCERDGLCDVCIEQAERAFSCVLEACPVCQARSSGAEG